MRRLVLVLLGAIFAALAAQVVMGGGVAAAAPGGVVVHRGGPDATVPFTVTSGGGEVEFDVTASAPGVDWSQQGDESAVVSVSADRNYATDVVIPFGQPITRHFVLGQLSPGRHRLRLHFATDRSALGARTAMLSGFHFTTYTPRDAGYLTAKFTAVLDGRNLADFGGPLDNAYSDTPLVAWHEATPAATPGHTTCSTRSSGATRTAAPTPRS